MKSVVLIENSISIMEKSYSYSTLPRAIRVNKLDNVATALYKLEPGSVNLIGQEKTMTFQLTDVIPSGHKFALYDIPKGAPITKYGKTIGLATRSIQIGECVHLQNCRSNYDE